jgi:hypothetical protein
LLGRKGASLPVNILSFNTVVSPNEALRASEPAGRFVAVSALLGREKSSLLRNNDFTMNQRKAPETDFRLSPGWRQPSILCRSMSRRKLFAALRFCRRLLMDLQIKLFSGLDRGNHVIVIIRGLVDIEGLRQIFRNIVNTTRSLLDCRVLVDLQDATYSLEPVDIHDFAVNLRPEFWPPTNRVALVSVPEPQDYSRLCLLSTFLSNRRIRNAVFKDTKSALSWLIETA